MIKDKIFNDVDALVAHMEKVRSFRKRLGKKDFKVGFVSAVLDLLHAGHTEFLQEAKKHCDFLVVSVASDERIKKKKGSDRPYELLHDRLIKAAGLESIDAITSHSTVEELENIINALKPGVIFAGGDYKNQEENILGSHLGYPVEIIDYPPRTKQRCTTNIADRIFKQRAIVVKDTDPTPGL